MGEALDNIRIILVEPAGPLNVGSVARVMKNMGLRHLVLVNPQCDSLGPEARQMAVHAVDILESAQQVESLPLGLTGCYRAIATTARARSSTVPLEPPRQVLPWLLDTPSALIFGPEDRGLNNEELGYAQRSLCIPSHPSYPSLNLAQAVAVCCYELYQLIQPDAVSESRSYPMTSADPSTVLDDSALAPMEQLEQSFQHLETVLLEIGYLHPHTAQSRMQKFRQIFHRAQLSGTELALLRGILRQMEWAAHRQEQPKERLKTDDLQK